MPKVKSTTSRVRSMNWFLTLNNPTKGDLVRIKEACPRYAIQYEKGEEGTKHLQGVLAFPSDKSFNQMKAISDKAHWEPARNLKQAWDYCTKEETRIAGPWIKGEPPKQGKRSDLLSLQEDLKAGATLHDVAENHFGLFTRYERGIRSYMKITTPGRDFKSTVIVLHGKPRTGKTRFAVKFPNYVFILSRSGNNQQFFDGYDPLQHETVIFDDYHGGIPWSEFLQLLDRYAYQVHTKGGSAMWKPKYIIITSNKTPQEWYPKMSSDPRYSGALEDRIDYQILYEGNGNCVLQKGDLRNLPCKIDNPVTEHVTEGDGTGPFAVQTYLNERFPVGHNRQTSTVAQAVQNELQPRVISLSTKSVEREEERLNLIERNRARQALTGVNLLELVKDSEEFPDSY